MGLPILLLLMTSCGMAQSNTASQSIAFSKKSQNKSLQLSNASTKSQTNKTSHNYQSDINHDVSFLKSKATISVKGVQWKPVIHPNPDAEVPDGFGGMLFAWNVILNGNGDGSTQQIYFFDNNRYLGKDSSKYHLPSSVHSGSTGTIIATYQHYLANDSMANPTGKPFIVSFHWDGSNLKPNNNKKLNSVVNDQFKSNKSNIESTSKSTLKFTDPNVSKSKYQTFSFPLMYMGLVQSSFSEILSTSDPNTPEIIKDLLIDHSTNTIEIITGSPDQYGALKWISTDYYHVQNNGELDLIQSQSAKNSNQLNPHMVLPDPIKLGESWYWKRSDGGTSTSTILGNYSVTFGKAKYSNCLAVQTYNKYQNPQQDNLITKFYLTGMGGVAYEDVTTANGTSTVFTPKPNSLLGYAAIKPSSFIGQP